MGKNSNHSDDRALIYQLERNIVILSITFGVGYSIGSNKLLVERLPLVLKYIFINPTVAVCVVAIVLNLIFPPPREGSER